MAQYMLLLHEDPTPPPAEMSPEVIQGIIQKYKDWSEKLGKEGKLAGGEKLQNGSGKVMRRQKNGKVAVTDGPYVETKEIIGGYFTISAASYDEAVRLAQDCPHLEFGGTIEVREVEVV